MEDALRREIRDEIKKFGGLPLTHDVFFQEVFAIFNIARKFLRFALPQKILDKLDVDHLKLESKNFLNKFFRKASADMIYDLPVANSEGHLRIFTILEHKSSNDFFAVFQGCNYGGLLGQKEIREAREAGLLNEDFRLSPFLVILFFHGPQKFTGPTNVLHTYRRGIIDDELMMQQNAISVDVSTLTDEEMPEDPELFSVFRIMQRIFDNALGTCLREILEKLQPYSHIPEYRYVIRLIFYYAISYADEMARNDLDEIKKEVKNLLGEREMSTVLDQLQAEGWAGGKIEGIAEGEARGEARGEAKKGVNILLRYLSRLGTVSDRLAERIRSITDIDELDRLTDIAWDCRSLDEFMEHLS